MASPIQTAVDSCGVNPTNQVFSASSVVPVLPAIGRPKTASLAVPPGSDVARSVFAVSSAAPWSMAWVQSALGTAIEVPLASRIWSMAMGLQYLPPEAKVA